MKVGNKITDWKTRGYDQGSRRDCTFDHNLFFYTKVKEEEK